MIKFFRQYRLSFLSEGKNWKYVKYAVGEIILVVLGILIALSINSWNTKRQNSKLNKTYLTFIKEDLAKDTVSLLFEINKMQIDSIQLQKQCLRLSDKNATVDTLVQIARYEFDPWYGSGQSFNNKTYESLISTGKIEIIGDQISAELRNLAELQLKYLELQKVSDDLYLDAYKNYSRNYSFKNANNPISGRLGENLWSKVDKADLLSDFNFVVGSKQVLFTNLLNSRRGLLEKTQDVIEIIVDEL